MADTQLAKYTDADGESHELSRDYAQKFILTGNGNLTDAEFERFKAICITNKMNPFRDVHLIKYGDKSPASCVTTVDYFERVASINSDYDGLDAGITVREKDGTITERDGCVYGSDEHLMGAWCRVYRKSRSHPTYCSANFGELVQTKRDFKTGEETPNHNWQKMPAWMSVKCMKSRALREAFPERFGGLYTQEEMPDRAAEQGQQQPSNSVAPVETPNDKPVKTTIPRSKKPEPKVETNPEPEVETLEPDQVDTPESEATDAPRELTDMERGFFHEAAAQLGEVKGIDANAAAREIIDRFGDPRTQPFGKLSMAVAKYIEEEKHAQG